MKKHLVWWVSLGWNKQNQGIELLYKMWLQEREWEREKISLDKTDYCGILNTKER